MAVNDNVFKIVSYNCKHFKDHGPKFDFINELFASCDILMLQEHCLYESEFMKLCKIGNGSGVEAVSAMDESIIRVGRPYGGCAIVWNPKLKGKVKSLVTNSKRLCAIIVSIEDVSFLFINVYMPCDGRDSNSVQFRIVLDDIVRLVSSNSSTYVVVGGDFNTDTSRQSSHVREFREFVNDNCFHISIDNIDSDVPYTFINGLSTSRIDHFLVSDNLKNICHCEITDNHLHSDHVPVNLLIKFDVSYLPTIPRSFSNKIAWHKVTDNDIRIYKNKLDNLLNKIVINQEVLLCCDTNCKVHTECIELLYKGIIDACCTASDHFPLTSKPKKQSNCIAGWNKYVASHRKEALSWHHIWKAQGRPRTGEVAEMHRLSRCKYHQAVRFVKRNADKIKMEKMAEAISKDNSRDLWREVRSIKGANTTVASSVDGLSCSKEIAELFSNKYKQLYNSVSYDAGEMYTLKKKIDSLVTNKCDVYKICIDDIVKAIKHLKSGKSGGCEGIFADHVIHGTHLLIVMLSLVYNAMIVHGTSPVLLVTGLMVPIPKDKKKSLCSSDNYRAIALSSILCKVLDLVILQKESHALFSCDQQFGFKSGLSTTHCTFVLQETVAYFNYNHTNVYTLLLDASKAFDRVQYCKLFEKLIERQMSPLVLRLLLYMYTNQQLIVQWDNIKSDNFSITNGVKQGGVLSPILFAVYTDGLLSRLKDSGIGCVMGNQYVGALAFADDLTLLSPTLSGLKEMIKICEDYASLYSIKFNGSKSKLIIYKGLDCSITNTGVNIFNEVVLPSESAVHLGHKLSTIVKDSIVKGANSDFWKSFNIFLANFGHLYSHLKNKLFVQYCCYFYGAPLWNLCGNAVHDLCVSWRKALRMLWGVPHHTHCDLIAALSGQKPLLLNLKERFCRFVNKCNNTFNSVVKTVLKFAVRNPYSNCGKNYIDLYCRKSDKLCANDNQWQVKATELQPLISCVKELVGVKEGSAHLPVFDYQEVTSLLDHVCTK